MSGAFLVNQNSNKRTCCMPLVCFVPRARLVAKMDLLNLPARAFKESNGCFYKATGGGKNMFVLLFRYLGMGVIGSRESARLFLENLPEQILGNLSDFP